MFELSPEMVAVLIPITAVIGTVIIIIVLMILQMREKELKHKEKMLAMEKGIEIPEDQVKEKKKRPRYLSIRMVGYVFAFIGASIFLGILVSSGVKDAVWGFIPLFFGLALLLSAHLEKKEIRQENTEF
jgi:F0F1-type ATP synthase membrane subunit a